MGLSYLKKYFSPILLNVQDLIEAWVQDYRVKIFTCENIIFELVQSGVDLSEKELQPHFTKFPNPL